jgi:RimJ/RimL family protein N-acetyltransferase
VAEIETPRLTLRRFTLADADEVFAAITPEVTRWMSWDPPTWEAFQARAAALAVADPATDMNFVIRGRDTGGCVGVCAAERLGDEMPELGIWLKVTAHGQGYGAEAVAALLRWASAASGKAGFLWPVAIQNTASRRIAERLGGAIIAERAGPKYDAVVYRVPSPP